MVCFNFHSLFIKSINVFKLSILNKLLYFLNKLREVSFYTLKAFLVIDSFQLGEILISWYRFGGL